MKNTQLEILSFRLNFIFNIYTQQELAKELNITQWQLLKKMKEKSFTDEEIFKIENICNEFSLKT
jgi:predicted methyltransferase